MVSEPQRVLRDFDRPDGACPSPACAGLGGCWNAALGPRCVASGRSPPRSASRAERAGAPARISVVEPDDAERVLNSKDSFDAPAGSLVVFDVPGSGGYGPPVERDPERLREDLRDGYLTPEGAMRDYGVEAPAAATASDAPPGADRGAGPRLSTVAETPEAKA